MSCDARIRPFPVGNDTEIACELEGKSHAHEGGDLDGKTHVHQGVLRDYAFPGSATVVSWLEGDRRNFRGVWPGRCQQLEGCVLPDGHHGRCAP